MMGIGDGANLEIGEAPTQLEVEIVNKSYGRAISSRFFDDFYNNLMDGNPAVQAKFKNTDMARQKQLLRQGVAYMIMYAKNTNAGIQAVRRLAVLHDAKHYDVQPALLELWTDVLIKTVANHDHDFREDMVEMWHKVLTPGLALFREAYREST